DPAVPQGDAQEAGLRRPRGPAVSRMQVTRLSNGVRVLSEHLPDLPSVTVGIWVENGSRYEERDQAGISHYLEHLFFKGTERRTAAQIAEEFDAVGGVLNAFTGKEYTCYYGKVLAEHLPVAEDILADIFLHSRFDPEEIERERTVVLQEISPVARRGVRYVEKALEQVHVCLGTPGLSQSANRRYAAYLLNTALGGGMSSRLFQEVREKRGRAYSVYSFLSSYIDAGYLGIYVG